MKTRFSLIGAVLAGLVLTGIPQWVMAGCSHYGVSYAYPAAVKQITVVKEVPVYVAAFTPVVAVGYAAPAVYTAGSYQPQIQQAMPQAMTQQMPDPCSQLKDRVAALERMLTTQQQPTGVNPPPTLPGAASPPGERVPPPASASSPPAGSNTPSQPQAGQRLTAAQVIAQRCAECHTAGRLKGGFALTGEDGRMLLLTPEQIRKVLSSAKGKPGAPPTMPKGKPPLNDEEFAALLDLLD